MKFTTIPFLALSFLLASAPLALANPINSGSKVDTTPTCVSDPEGFMTVADARSCFDEIAAKGTQLITTKAPGQAMCVRRSGVFWAGIGGDADQSAAA